MLNINQIQSVHGNEYKTNICIVQSFWRSLPVLYGHSAQIHDAIRDIVYVGRCWVEKTNSVSKNKILFARNCTLACYCECL